MADIHIEDFYKDCARILLQLYMAFPRRSSVFVEDIAGPDTPDEFGLHSKRHMACLGAMLWLADEGLLRYESTISQDAIDQAVLTEAGFLALIRLLPAEEHDLESPPQTAAHRVRDTLQKGTSTQVARVVHRMLFPH